jgi:hypothetical protein
MRAGPSDVSRGFALSMQVNGGKALKISISNYVPKWIDE